jgi:hypothetical protein
MTIKTLYTSTGSTTQEVFKDWALEEIYEATLQPHLPYERMQVVISSPKNLRDILTSTALHNAGNVSAKTS